MSRSKQDMEREKFELWEEEQRIERYKKIKAIQENEKYKSSEESKTYEAPISKDIPHDKAPLSNHAPLQSISSAVQASTKVSSDKDLCNEIRPDLLTEILQLLDSVSAKDQEKKKDVKERKEEKDTSLEADLTPRALSENTQIRVNELLGLVVPTERKSTLTDKNKTEKDHYTSKVLHFILNHTAHVSSESIALSEYITLLQHEVNTLFIEKNHKVALLKIKEGLQFCNKNINYGKYPHQEYGLFLKLAEIYHANNDINEYPKIAAIYQYLIKYVDIHLKKDFEKFNDIKNRINNIESEFLKKFKLNQKENKGAEFKETKEAEDPRKAINVSTIKYKDRLTKFREHIIERLKAIDNEELNKIDLPTRSRHIQQIYKEISDFFIGRRNEKGELVQKGLLNDLIKDCIKDLGGLPKVGEHNQDCKYSVVGSGSLALGTTTPWSDIEFAIIIQDGLYPLDEKKVKDFFKALTNLLNLKVITYFDETLLRTLGIEELNNFKLTNSYDYDPHYNWFIDRLSTKGLAFDGKCWFGCKTPEGREKGYKKTVEVEVEGIKTKKTIDLDGFTLTCSETEFEKYFSEPKWIEEDPYLVHALGHIILIEGSSTLVSSYHKMLGKYKKDRKQNELKNLIDDLKKFNPYKQILDKDKIGAIMSAKFDFYRLIDRTLVALGDCLNVKEDTNWNIIEGLRKVIGDEAANELLYALTIATEIRLRTYSMNKGQNEDVTALTHYSSQINDLREKNDLIKKVFNIKDINLLLKYYQIVTALTYRIEKIKNIEDLSSLVEILRSPVSGKDSKLIAGLVKYRFLKYSDAIKDFEEVIESKDSTTEKNIVKPFLARLYQIIGENDKSYELWIELYKEAKTSSEKALILDEISVSLDGLKRHKDSLKCKLESLKLYREIHKGEEYHLDIANALSNVARSLITFERYFEALFHEEESFRIRREKHKDNINHPDITQSIDAIGNILARKKIYRTAKGCFFESFLKKVNFYRGNHPDIAVSLDGMGNCSLNLKQYDKALVCFQDGYEIRRKIYDQYHTDKVITLNKISFCLIKLGKFNEALTYTKISLEMQQSDYSNMADSLRYLGEIFYNLRKYKEALRSFQTIYHIEKKLSDSTYDLSGVIRNISSFLNAEQYCNDGDILSKKHDYTKAIKSYIASLSIWKVVYQDENHFEVALVLSKKGICHLKLDEFHIALADFLCSLGMYEMLSPPDSSKIKDLKFYILICVIHIVNNHILSYYNYSGAIDYLNNNSSIIGKFITTENLLETLFNFAKIFSQKKYIKASIHCYEALCKLAWQQKDVSNYRYFKYNMACEYNLQSIFDKKDGNEKKSKENFLKAQEMYEDSVSNKIEGLSHPKFLIEYVHFLMINHNVNNIDEYRRIKVLLDYYFEYCSKDLIYIDFNNRSVELTYQPLQEILNNTYLSVNIKYLAYYFLIEINILHNNKIESVDDILKEFKNYILYCKNNCIDEKNVGDLLFNLSLSIYKFYCELRSNGSHMNALNLSSISNTRSPEIPALNLGPYSISSHQSNPQSLPTDFNPLEFPTDASGGSHIRYGDLSSGGKSSDPQDPSSASSVDSSKGSQAVSLTSSPSTSPPTTSRVSQTRAYLSHSSAGSATSVPISGSLFPSEQTRCNIPVLPSIVEAEHASSLQIPDHRRRGALPEAPRNIGIGSATGTPMLGSCFSSEQMRSGAPAISNSAGSATNTSGYYLLPGQVSCEASPATSSIGAGSETVTPMLGSSSPLGVASPTHQSSSATSTSGYYLLPGQVICEASPVTSSIGAGSETCTPMLGSLSPPGVASPTHKSSGAPKEPYTTHERKVLESKGRPTIVPLSSVEVVSLALTSLPTPAQPWVQRVQVENKHVDNQLEDRQSCWERLLCCYNKENKVESYRSS
jgi:hypothetical protein